MSLLVAAVAISLIPTEEPAAASPATALLEAMKARMEESYYAPPGVDVTRVMDDASRKLAVACAPQGAACPIETGLEIARAALVEIGDRHTTISRMPTPPPGTAAPRPGGGPTPGVGGPPAQRLPLGMATRTVRGQDHIYAAWVDPEGPAGKAGIRRHDRIVPPAGTTAAMLNNATAAVRVTVERQGQTFEVELTPDASRSSAAPLMTMVGDVAVIHFPSGTGDGMGQVGHDLLARARAANARAVVLDLRDNGGGGLQCAAMTAGFTDYTSVMRDRQGVATVLSAHPDHIEMGPENALETVLTLERPARWTGPLAVVVNENTGSCAESMAIQLNRAGRGVVIGEQTYGVGNNTLRPMPLTDGWAIQLTTSYSETETGVRLPPRPPLTVEVEDDPIAIGRTGEDAVLKAALDRLKTV